MGVIFIKEIIFFIVEYYREEIEFEMVGKMIYEIDFEFRRIGNKMLK